MQPTSMQKQNHLQKTKGEFNMFKTMKKRIKNQKGLTLVELLAVIVILAIVAAIAVPAIGNIIDNSRIKAAKADALNILNAANIYVTDNPGVSQIAYSGTTYTLTGTGTDFGQYIADLGQFEGDGFTITNTNGVVSISTTGTISLSNGVTIDFNNARITDIDASDANTDGTGNNAPVKVVNP